MELRRLRYFVAVAEEGGVTRAAVRLGMQQPPLSQQIRALEAELGVRLFDRTPKRVRLNRAGEVFLEGARRTLAAAEAAVERVRRYDQGVEGSIAVGFTSSASLHRLTPGLLRAFRAAYPRVELEVEEGGAHELMLSVEGGGIDLAFVRIPVADSADLASYRLEEEEIVAALPVDHPLAARREPLPLTAFRDQDIVLYRRPEGRGLYDILVAGFRGAGFTPRVVDETTRVLAALNLVAASRGVTFAPASLDVVHADLIHYRRLAPGAFAPAPLTLVHRRGNDSPALKNFIRVVRP